MWVAATAAIGAVEYPVAQFPPALAAAATVDVYNVAGMLVESLPVAATPSRGYFGSQHGDTMVLRTPALKVVVSSASAVGPPIASFFLAFALATSSLDSS